MPRTTGTSAGPVAHPYGCVLVAVISFFQLAGSCSMWSTTNIVLLPAMIW